MKTKTFFLKLGILILVLSLSSCMKKNHPPTIDDQTFSVDENSAAGTLVGTVQAFDEEGQPLTYSILGGNTNTAFGISETDGKITVSNKDAIDFETTPSFTLKVQVKDSKNKNAVANITINLNNIELSVNDQTFSIDENSAVGTTVGQITFPGQSFKYSVVSGNLNTAFDISETDGKITVHNKAALDYETTPKFILVVQVKDANNEKANVNININLNNIIIPLNDQSFSIDENSDAGSLVGQVLAPGQTLKYSIISGNTTTAFDISETDGKITVHNPDAMDYEAVPKYTLTIEGKDVNDEKGNATITINLNNLDMPTSGLVLYMPFDGNVNDLSLNSNNGIDYTSHNYVAGKKSQAMDFNGISDYIQLSNTINSQYGLSFSFWINTRGAKATENNGSIISKYSKINNTRCFMVYSFGSYDTKYDNRLSAAFYADGYSSSYHDMTKSYLEPGDLVPYPNPSLWTILNPTRLIAGEWTHCLVNLTPTAIETWINGKLCTKKTREYSSYSTSNTEPVFIGNNYDIGEGTNNHFNGILDELRVYNRGLSKKEIMTLFKE